MRFLFLFRGGDASQEAWGAWMSDLQKQGIWQAGLPLAGGKMVSPTGVADYLSHDDDITGYMEVETSSLDDAVQLAKQAPNISSGGRVEVRQSISH